MMNMNLRQWRPLPALLGAALLALVVRVGYLAELNGSPFLSVLLGDSRQYDAWAQQIAGGQWVGTEIFYQTPLYPYWLAVIFSIAGHNLGLVRLIQAILGAASCLLLGLAGRRFFSDRVGVIAALLLAVYPPAFFFDGLIQKSSLDIFLVTLALALLGEFYRRPTLGRVALKKPWRVWKRRLALPTPLVKPMQPGRSTRPYDNRER